MKISYAFAAGLLAALAAGANAQSQTTETKVGVNLKGVSVTRKHGQGSSSRTTKVDLTRNGVAVARRRTTRVARVSRRQSNIKVVLDGDPIAFPDQQPIMENNSVLVPMRGVFEKMGGTLTWDRGTNTVTAMKDGKKVVLPLESSTATVDGEKITLHQPAILLNGRAMVPLRFLSESLGAQVLWKAAEQTVTIDS